MWVHCETKMPEDFRKAVMAALKREGLPTAVKVLDDSCPVVDTPVLSFGKPVPELVASTLPPESEPDRPVNTVIPGPSVKQVLNTPAGYERLRRAIRLWKMHVEGTLVDPHYEYEIVVPGSWPAEFGCVPGSSMANIVQTTLGHKQLVVDIEVSGDIKVDQPEDTKLISVAVLFVRPDDTYRILVWSREALEDDECRDALAAILTCGVPLLAHNGQFDFKWLNNRLRKELTKCSKNRRRWGHAYAKRPRRIYPKQDTLIKHYCMFPGATGDHGLKDLAQKLCGAPEWEKEIKQYTKGKAHYENIPPFLLYSYNAADVYWTWKLDVLFDEWMEEAGEPIKQLYWKLAMPASRMFIDIESTEAGWPVNMVYALKLEAKMSKLAAKELAKLRKKVGDPVPYLSATNARQREAWLLKGMELKDKEHNFNPGSPLQVKKWLWKHGYIVSSTNAETLDELKDSGALSRKDQKFLDLLLEYRHTTKMLNSYVTGVIKTVRNGRARPRYQVAGTVTGRLSATKPAIQTIPKIEGHDGEDKVYREMFGVEDGEVLVGCDYAQMETRCVAELCGDPQMIDDLQLGRPDFFAILLPQVFPDRFHSLKEAVNAKTEDPGAYKFYRGRIKPFSHGINYGRGAKAIAIAEKMPDKEAYRIRDVYLGRYPKLVQWQAETMSYVVGHRSDPEWEMPGLYTTFGRRFQQGVLTDRTVNGIKNSALAFRPQSIGSDICVTAALDLHHNHLDKYQARLVGFVHDALYVICPKEFGKEVMDLVSERMTASAARVFKKVPFPVDGHIGLNWAEVSG